jgi:LPXTG-motif cell wall-anchored protein
MPSALRVRHGLAIALAVLAFPAGALAQGAGDDQYSDPFGADATPTPKPKATATPAPTVAAPAAATPAASAPSTAAAAPSATPAKPQLPYTGLNAIVPAAGGALLLGSGLALRKRVRD